MDPDPYRAITEGERFVAETVGEQVCSLLAANHGLSLSQMDVLNLVADALLQVLPDIDLTPCPDQTAQELVSEFLAENQGLLILLLGERESFLPHVDVP